MIPASVGSIRFSSHLTLTIAWNSPSSLLSLLCGTFLRRLGLLARYLSERVFHYTYTALNPGYFPSCDGRGMARRTWDEFLLPPIGLAVAHCRDPT